MQLPERHFKNPVTYFQVCIAPENSVMVSYLTVQCVTICCIGVLRYTDKPPLCSKRK